MFHLALHLQIGIQDLSIRRVLASKIERITFQAITAVTPLKQHAIYLWEGFSWRRIVDGRNIIRLSLLSNLTSAVAKDPVPTASELCPTKRLTQSPCMDACYLLISQRPCCLFGSKFSLKQARHTKATCLCQHHSCVNCSYSVS